MARFNYKPQKFLVHSGTSYPSKGYDSFENETKLELVKMYFS